MARVNGPLFSLDASGSLAGTVVFSKWKGRPYVRQLVRPSNPKSGGQVSMRATLKFLAQNWAALTLTKRNSWNDLADAGTFSTFNAYTKVNLTRNADFLAPHQDATDTQIETPSVIGTFTALAGVRSITVTVNDTDLADPSWGYLLYRNLTPAFTPGFDNLHAIILANAAVDVTFIDTGLEPDTYYYDTKPFTLDGSIGILSGEINAIIT